MSQPPTPNPQSLSPDVVIKVEHLSKQYKLGSIGHGTLYRDLQSWWAKLRGRDDPNSVVSHSSPLNSQTLTPNPQSPDFWALKDVSFEVKRGEVVGIIGRNGAGKSTLLKILSRVTGPTSGSVKIKGRVASLLEVGTGFHPELTGRENIYLNGTILGMKKKEIDTKFDEIVAFAEIEQFIDTPVKRYSSGMYVRLAFAVAAHLEPEILIVDEVLAVGDMAFQKKCLGKMGEVSREGRTVLFVSHNMAAVSNLCNRCIVLSNGEIQTEGRTNEVVDYYQSQFYSHTSARRDLLNVERTGKNENGKITEISITDLNGNYVNIIPCGERINFDITVDFFREIDSPEIGILIMSSSGQRVTRIPNTAYLPYAVPVSKRIWLYSCEFENMFVPGQYYINVWLRQSAGQGLVEADDFIENAISFEVVPNEINGVLPYFGWCQPGEVFTKAKWTNRLL
ncbi:MAG: ABC transporter ATP-binding protein [Negativicutes bacterium]